MDSTVIRNLFLLLFIINCALLAQSKDSEQEQDALHAETPQYTVPIKKSLKEIYIPSEKETKILNEELNEVFFKQGRETESKNNKEESVFNILSASYRNNIRFGGFLDKYAIINFTPSVFIKPLSFVSVYASHSYSFFVPMDGLKEHVKSLLIQGAAILVVDNSIKLFFNTEDVIPKIAGFIFKTLIITEVMKTVNRNKSNPMYELKNFRYSISIRL